MSATTTRWAAAATVVITAAAGAITNLITSRWSWTLAVALATLIIGAAVLAYLTAGSPAGAARVTQRVSRNGRIQRSRIRARNGAAVDQRATRGGIIDDSGIDAQ